MARHAHEAMQWRITLTWNRSAERWDVHVTDGRHARLVDQVSGYAALGWTEATLAARAAADDVRSQLPI